MTTMFAKFFGMPQCVIRSGTWAVMRPSERSLYCCLLHESERCRSRKFQREDAKVCELAGISPRACRDARIKLQERGLICCERGRGNVYVYTLCNPETQKPWPGDHRLRIPYVKKSDSDRASSPTTLSAPTDTTLPDRKQPESKEIHGVPLSFTGS